MDYLLVIWKWKYDILAGTLAFALAAGIISFITWKQQPQMYRTHIVLKPEISKIDLGIDDKGVKASFDSLETIKTLIENDLKYKVLDYIKNSNNTNLSTSLEFQVDIPKGSDIINVSLESAMVDEGTTKLNYLIKALLADFPNKTKYVQKLKKETKNNFGAQQNIAEISKEIEKLEKEKLNIQNIQIIQPPVTTELPKTKSKIKRNVILSSVLGIFLMLFLSFFLESISKYKSKASHKSTSKLHKEM